MNMYFVYILSNSRRTVFYVGVTNNIIRRVQEHRDGVPNSFASKYHCTDLLYFEETNDVREAITWGKTVKKFRREKKLQLIKNVNPAFLDLTPSFM